MDSDSRKKSIKELEEIYGAYRGFISVLRSVDPPSGVASEFNKFREEQYTLSKKVDNFLDGMIEKVDNMEDTTINRFATRVAASYWAKMTAGSHEFHIKTASGTVTFVAEFDPKKGVEITAEGPNSKPFLTRVLEKLGIKAGNIWREAKEHYIYSWLEVLKKTIKEVQKHYDGGVDLAGTDFNVKVV